MLDVMVVRPRLVTRDPRRQRLGRFCPVDTGENDQRNADHDGKPDERTAALHRDSLVILLCARPDKRKSRPWAALSFAESISLSSTGSADLRLPPTASGSGFDLLALRARRKRESRRGHVLPQEVRKTKMAQFARIQLSTFPQQTLQLVERTIFNSKRHRPRVRQSGFPRRLWRAVW